MCQRKMKSLLSGSHLTFLNLASGRQRKFYENKTNCPAEITDRETDRQADRETDRINRQNKAL